MADAVKCLLVESMKTWRTNLTANNVSLGKMCTRRGIFQGDSLSLLMFVLALIDALVNDSEEGECRLCYEEGFMDDLKLFAKKRPETDSLEQTVRIFSDDIRMQFGLTKCVSMTMKTRAC